MSGSEQFLGRQLTSQAEALGLLVEKMDVMVKAMGKFAQASDEVKIYQDYTKGTKLIASNKIKFIPFFDGTCRIFVTGNSTDLTNPNGQATVSINGVIGSSVSRFPKNSLEPIRLYMDIAVKEGDEVLIYSTNSTYNVDVVKFEVAFDEIVKPSGAIV